MNTADQLKRIKELLGAVTGFEDDDQQYVDDARDTVQKLIEALAEQTAQQDSACSNTLRAQGKAYPRTCKKCGLGPCVGLAQQALDKMAENARELGLDYEPAQQQDGPINEGWQITVTHGHSGYGVYAHMEDYPEEGAVFVMPIEQPAQKQEPVSLKSLAQKAGINLPETYIPTMDDAIAAGDSVLMNEQAALLRECRAALDSLIAQKPTLAGLLCGSTTLGNLKAELGAYRPKGVLGTPPASKQWVGLTDEEKSDIWCVVTNRDFVTEDTHVYADAIEAKLKEKNNG